jgi:hypothetical protein
MQSLGDVNQRMLHDISVPTPTDVPVWRQAEIETAKAMVGMLNLPAQLLAGVPLIGNGADGTADHRDGFDGGLLMGNGGNGVYGGNGGNALGIGNGGNGGDGAGPNRNGGNGGTCTKYDGGIGIGGQGTAGSSNAGNPGGQGGRGGRC